MSVTFFNLFGESFEKEMKAVGDSEVIIVIAFARVNKYEGQLYKPLSTTKLSTILRKLIAWNQYHIGELYLANYPATRFYINPKHYCVKEFQER